ncbi:MAG: hydroxymethylbilane synthase [Candidatus Latescibacterota bacterium]|nr:MAG: hydroxymethylbilane synthase [Candidatus Latescibacterota bacterium]
MTTMTRCRLASDIDFLSKLELEEVSRELRGCSPKLVIEHAGSEEGESPFNGDGLPNSPSRVARLMSGILEEEYDALVLNAAYLPSRLPAGLTIGAITNRLTPFDVLISSNDCLLDELPENATVVANDVRREAQLLYYRSDFKMVRSKGSVDSIIQKVKSAKLDAAVLAASDVERLHKQDHVVEFLTCSICVPAAGQGSLAVLLRSDEEQIKKCVRSINHPASYGEIIAEWAFLDHLGVSNNTPVGVLGSIEGKTLELEGMVALPDGHERIHSVVKGAVGHEVELGQRLATEILEAGGRDLLQELNLH